jgi:hypothetical protein
VNASQSNAFAVVAKSALVGTQQQPFAAVTGVETIDALIAPASVDAPERALLRAAGVLGFVRRTARRARVFEEAPVPAADDPVARAGPLAGIDLRAILEARNETLLAEWLALARRFERRVPEELLPALFSFAGSKTALHDALRATTGERGRWLAAKRPAWTWLRDPVDPRATFAHGTRPERAAALRLLREREPDAARDLLAATFAKDAASDRAALLGSHTVSARPTSRSSTRARATRAWRCAPSRSNSPTRSAAAPPSTAPPNSRNRSCAWNARS